MYILKLSIGDNYKRNFTLALCSWFNVITYTSGFTLPIRFVFVIRYDHNVTVHSRIVFYTPSDIV